MALTAGTRLGPYVIQGPLGAGGMGEVYLARDERLGRDVAVKVLPEHLADTPEALARFEREARAVSSLNHPHICTLFDVGNQDGVEYIVLERLEGETLAARLERGPLPVDELLRIGSQIADALDRAHRTGLVHRDLKPGNIMLTKGGAKLLDFGLARPTTPAAPPPGSSAISPTISPSSGTPLTVTGSIVGTFQYMSPEQLEGREADARTDLWALGLVLYEMASGHRAFEGRSQASLIAAILEREAPKLSTVAPLVPPGLDRLVQACLAKDPDERVQTAHDVKLQLRWIAEGGSQAGVPAPVAARRRSRERLSWIVAGVAAVAAVALGAALVLRGRTEPPRMIRFMVPAPAGQVTVTWPRISPDSRMLAFLATDSTNVTRIWVRSFDSFDAHPLPGTEGAERPFWSPDGRFLAFMSTGKLKKVPVDGGPAVLICDAPGRHDGSWGAGGVILLDGTVTDSLMGVPAEGGVAKPASSFDRKRSEAGHAWPFFLPDGKHFVFIVSSTVGGGTVREQHVKLGTLGSLESVDLGATNSRVEFCPPDRLTFMRDDVLVSQRLDLGAKKLVGDPVPVTDQRVSTLFSGLFSVSRTGSLALISNTLGSQSQLVWMDRTGKRLGTVGQPGIYRDLALSPDARRVAVGLQDPRTNTEDIWVLDIERGVASRLTFDQGNDIWPVWSPDGLSLWYSSDRGGLFSPYRKRASGVGTEDSLVTCPFNCAPTGVTSDGQTLAIAANTSTQGWDIYVRPTDPAGKAQVFLGTPVGEREATFSPDGRYLAYRSNETGRPEIYVRSFPDGEGKWQISKDGGYTPIWTKGGKEIVFQSLDAMMMAVPIELTPDFRPGEPVRLFPFIEADGGFNRNRWVPTADGERFLINTPVGQAERQEFSVTLNAMQALPRK